MVLFHSNFPFISSFLMVDRIELYIISSTHWCVDCFLFRFIYIIIKSLSVFQNKLIHDIAPYYVLRIDVTKVVLSNIYRLLFLRANCWISRVLQFFQNRKSSQYQYHTLFRNFYFCYSGLSHIIYCLFRFKIKSE